MWSCQTMAGPQPQSCHFRFNLRKREIAWEIFMQIRRVLRDYLATALMDVSLLEVNLTFCFSCQKGGLCGPICLWMTEDAGWTSYMPVNPSPIQSGGSRRPQWGSPLIVQSWEGIPSGRIWLTVLSTGSTSNHR